MRTRHPGTWHCRWPELGGCWSSVASGRPARSWNRVKCCCCCCRFLHRLLPQGSPPPSYPTCCSSRSRISRSGSRKREGKKRVHRDCQSLGGQGGERLPHHSQSPPFKGSTLQAHHLVIRLSKGIPPTGQEAHLQPESLEGSPSLSSQEGLKS